MNNQKKKKNSNYYTLIIFNQIKLKINNKLSNRKFKKDERKKEISIQKVWEKLILIII